MAVNKSNYLETATLNSFLTAAVIARPTAWAVSLHTGDPGETGVSNEVAGGIGYSRQAITWNTPSAGVLTNAVVAAFGPATSGWGTVSAIGIWETAPGANFLYLGSLDVFRVVASGESFELLAESIQVAEA